MNSSRRDFLTSSAAALVLGKAGPSVVAKPALMAPARNPFVYKFAKEEYGSIVPALQAYVLVFLALSVLTWAVYVRRGATMSRV